MPVDILALRMGTVTKVEEDIYTVDDMRDQDWQSSTEEFYPNECSVPLDIMDMVVVATLRVPRGMGMIELERLLQELA